MDWSAPLTRAELADWLANLLSVVAIIVAFYALFEEKRHARQLQDERENEFIEAASSLITQAADIIGAAAQNVEAGQDNPLNAATGAWRELKPAHDVISNLRQLIPADANLAINLSRAHLSIMQIEEWTRHWFMIPHDAGADALRKEETKLHECVEKLVAFKRK